MSGDDPLDALFEDLRQPATASELAGESTAVDAAVTAMMSTKGTSMHLLSNSRRLRVASFVAAGIIGFGGVAAAGPAVYDTVAGGDEPQTDQPVDDGVDEPSDSVETTVAPETSVVETTTAPSVPENDDPELDPVLATTDDEVDVAIDDEDDAVTTSVALVDDPDTEFDETTCAEGNHGQTVSSIAHETPSGPGKGQIVSEAAHSSCGKLDKHDESDDDESDHESDDDESDRESDDDESDHESDDESDHESDDKPNKPNKPGKPDKSDKSDAHGSSAGGGKGNSSNGKGKHQDD